MRFLIDASLPLSTASVLHSRGHESIDVCDIGLRHAPDTQVASHAKADHLALISADFDFADIRVYPPSDYQGLVVIDRPSDAPVADVLRLIERFLDRADVIANLPGRLVVADARRIRIRPPLPE